MKQVCFRRVRNSLTLMLLILCINVWGYCNVNTVLSEGDNDLKIEGKWENEERENRSIVSIPISIYQSSWYLTIQDSNPVNTVMVRITCNDSGATVFENVYSQGQTGYIVIPMSDWSAGNYTIELFGRENNGYLVGTFQILP